jgi:hypothetical protein
VAKWYSQPEGRLVWVAWLPAQSTPGLRGCRLHDALPTSLLALPPALPVGLDMNAIHDALSCSQRVNVPSIHSCMFTSSTSNGSQPRSQA